MIRLQLNQCSLSKCANFNEYGGHILGNFHSLWGPAVRAFSHHFHYPKFLLGKLECKISILGWEHQRKVARGRALGTESFGFESCISYLLQII